MATYNINDLTIQNGKLYAGGVEVGAKDTVGGLPAWGLTPDRLSKMIGQVPDTSNNQGSMFDAPTQDPFASARGLLPQLGSVGDSYRSQVNPVTEFANTGQNRNFLYGAYGAGANSTVKNPPAYEGGSMFDYGQMANPYPTYSNGIFDRKTPIPDLNNWTGEEYSPTNEWIGDASQQASQDAQKILKQFYPNISQDELDKAAYKAMQKGDKYYSGTGAPSENTANASYYGHGPLPTVTAIAKELGMTPQLNQFLDQNWSQFADKYAGLRNEAKANASAEDKARMMENIKGVTGIVGGAFGLSSLLSGGLGSLLGGSNIMGPAMESGAMGTTGAAGAAGGTSMFDGLGDWFSGLFDSGTSGGNWWDAWDPNIAESAASASDWGGVLGDTTASNWWDAWDPNIADPSVASPEDWGNAGSSLMDQAKNYITQNPGSTIKSALQALTGGGNANLLGAGLGGILGSLGGGNKPAGTTDVTQTPWGPQQPYLLDAWAKAKAASDNPRQTQANSNFSSVLSGPTTNPMLGLDNPYLQKQIDYANQDVTRAMMPAMNQANRASGSFGNSGVADQFGKSLTDAYSKNANDMRYKDYYAQQQLQKDAVGNTLGFTTGASAFNAAPAQDYAKTVQGNYGGTTSSPYFTNPTNSILGGAALGSQFGKLWG